MDYLARQKAGEDIILIDVRNAPAHLKKEKIAGALEIPLNVLGEKMGTLSKNQKVVVYCWDV